MTNEQIKRFRPYGVLIDKLNSLCHTLADTDMDEFERRVNNELHAFVNRAKIKED